MEETAAPAEVKSDPSAHTANNTPSKPRQGGHAAAKKQTKAAKQLRFEGQTGAYACHCHSSWWPDLQALFFQLVRKSMQPMLCATCMDLTAQWCPPANSRAASITRCCVHLGKLLSLQPQPLSRLISCTCTEFHLSPAQVREAARHRITSAAVIQMWTKLRHRLTWPQEHTQEQISPCHTHHRNRPPQAAIPISQPWKSMQFTPETLLLAQAAKAASQSVARGLQPPRVHRLGQMEAMDITQHMRPSQAMGITQYMGTMLTMSLALCMARERSRLCTGHPNRMTRVLASTLPAALQVSNYSVFSSFFLPLCSILLSLSLFQMHFGMKKPCKGGVLYSGVFAAHIKHGIILIGAADFPKSRKAFPQAFPLQSQSTHLC